MTGLVLLAIVAVLLAGPDVLATGAFTAVFWLIGRVAP
jgi:hypothetical protein